MRNEATVPSLFQRSPEGLRWILRVRLLREEFEPGRHEFVEGQQTVVVGVDRLETGRRHRGIESQDFEELGVLPGVDLLVVVAVGEKRTKYSQTRGKRYSSLYKKEELDPFAHLLVGAESAPHVHESGSTDNFTNSRT